MIRCRNILFLIVLLGLVAVAAGCSKSAPASYFILSSVESGTPPASPCFSVGVGPVDVPSYVDRIDLMLRSGENSMALSEFDQWVEPVQDGVKRILIENLSSMICAEPIVAFPWPMGIYPAYQVTVQIQQFDAVPGQFANLKASWAILDTEGDPLAWKSFSGSEPTTESPEIIAQSLSKLVGQLSRDIADELRAMH